MSLEIQQVEGRRGTARFIDVAWKVQQKPGSLWVPPLRLMVSGTLNRKSNPFYANADRALFIASRRGRPVGRIAAIENRHHNEHFGDRVGFFGFFECEDDDEAATALFAEVRAWLAERSLESFLGPVNPSMHDELGILVDGFEVPPMISTPWNPPYYGALIEAAGLSQVKDLLGFDIPMENGLPFPDSTQRLSDRLRKRLNLKFRRWDSKTFQAEARRGHSLYCDSWAEQWGFVPPTWEQFWHLAKDLKSVLHPDFAFGGEIDGELTGFMMIARDLNEVLARIPSGRLWPWNLIRLPFLLGRTKNLRVVLLGFKKEFRGLGLFPLFVAEAARRGIEHGIGRGEASWVLEENEALVGPLTAMGLQATKRWRLYQDTIG